MIYDTRKLAIETETIVERLKVTPAMLSCAECGSTGPFSRKIHSDQDGITLRFALVDTCKCGASKITKKLSVDLVDAGILPQTKSAA